MFEHIQSAYRHYRVQRVQAPPLSAGHPGSFQKCSHHLPLDTTTPETIPSQAIFCHSGRMTSYYNTTQGTHKSFNYLMFQSYLEAVCISMREADDQ